MYVQDDVRWSKNGSTPITLARQQIGAKSATRTFLSFNLCSFFFERLTYYLTSGRNFFDHFNAQTMKDCARTTQEIPSW